MEELQSKGPLPLYYQLELLIRRRIETGELRPGDVLQSENTLAEELGVSRITVRRAWDRLEEDGLIVRRRGSRTRVASHLPRYTQPDQYSGEFRGLEDELRQQGLEPRAKILEIIEGGPPEHVKAALKLVSDTEIVRIRRVGLLRDVPIWTETRYFPLDVGRALDVQMLSHASALTALAETGNAIEQVEMRLEAVTATPRQATLLRIAAGDPLLLHESIAVALGGRPVQVTRVYLRGDYYSLVLHARPKGKMDGLHVTGGGYLVGGAKQEATSDGN